VPAGMLPPVLFEVRARADQAIKEMGVLKSAVSGASESGKVKLSGLAGVGRLALFGLAAGVAIVGVEGVKMGTKFQTAMTLLKTGAGELDSNMATVQSGILHMAGQVGVGALELANSMYVVESAGYHGAAGLKVLQAAAEGSKTDGADLKIVVDGLTTVMNDLHAPASQAAKVMSMMVTAVGQGKMRMDDFAGSIHNVLPTATKFGLSFAQVAGALATMTARGMSAAQASQNLNHMIIKLGAPTQGMTTAMAAYGLSAQDVSQKLGQRGLTGTLKLITDAITKHMGPAGLVLQSTMQHSAAMAQNAATMMSGLPPAAKKIAEAYANGTLKVKDWRSALKGLPGPQANLLTQWKGMQDKAHGFADALKSGSPAAKTFIAALKGMLGDQTGMQVALQLSGESAKDFAGSVKKISGAVPEAGGHVKDWATVQKNLGVQVAQVKAGIGAWVTEIGTKLVPVLSTALGWMQKHTGTMKVIAAVIGGVLLVAIGAYIVSMAAAAIATIAATWPILLIIAAVALVVAAIWYLATHWKQIWADIKKWAGEFWHWLKAAFKAGLDAVKAGWNESWGNVKRWFHEAITAIKGWGVSFWNWIKGAFKSGLNAIKAGWNESWGNVKRWFKEAIDGIKGWASSFWGWIKSVWNSGLTAIKNAWSTAWNAVVTFVKGVPGKVVAAFSAAKTLLLQKGRDIIAGMGAGITDAAKAVGGWIKTVGTKIIDAVKHFFGIKSPSTVFHGLGSHIIQGLLNGILSGKSGLDGVVRKVFSGVTGSITGLMKFAAKSGGSILDMLGLGGGGGGMNVGNLAGAPSSVSGNAAIVQSVAGSFGWGSGANWNALYQLVMHESGFRNTAANPSSSAYGLFQFLNGTWGGVGGHKTSDPWLQALYGMRYIKGSYGNPLRAWSKWQSRSPHWYDAGGWLMPGRTMAVNATGSPERVLTGKQFAGLQARAAGGGGGDVVVHSHVYLDGKQIYESVQRSALRYNRRNQTNGLAAV